MHLQVGARGINNFTTYGKPIDGLHTFYCVSGEGVGDTDGDQRDGDFRGGVRLNDAKDLIVLNGLAGVVYVENVSVEGRAQVVLVEDVGEIENEARARVFVGSLLREEDCAIDPGTWRNDGERSV